MVHPPEKCNYFGGGKSDMITVVVPGDRMKRLPKETIPERKRRLRELQQREAIKQDRCVLVLCVCGGGDEIVVWSKKPCHMRTHPTSHYTQP